MPEEERRRDPLGANRGKTMRQHASRMSGAVKKHIHDKYYIPPYRPVNRNWEITFASLGWKRRTIQKFWRLYCRINTSHDGGIKLEEFLYFFDLDWTPWTERCFRYFDTTGGGDIDFLEFMVSVWNVCTLKIDTLSNFAFDMYDTDEDGELSIPEIEIMIEELYGEKGGMKCLRQITQYAEERGGALRLDAFIAFSGSHQMLLFPMFLIQQKLQRRVFGKRFWLNLDRRSKENRKGTKNQNEFNPRHVQILLRTYQSGGAAAVLSHTGDPNKGLRDWYENQKQKDMNEDIPADEVPGLERWRSVRNSMVSNPKAKRIIKNGVAMKRQTLQRMKSFKGQTRRGRTNGISQIAAASALGHNSSNLQPAPSAPPREDAIDFFDGSAKGTSNVANKDPNKSRQSNSRPSSASAPPKEVAEALKTIRAKRASISTPKDKPDSRFATDRPGSATSLPPDVAEALQTIRARRLSTAENNTKSDHVERPTSASSPPPEITEALRGIRARRREKSVRASDVENNAKSRRKSKHKRRSSNSMPNNVRQRQAGSMFVPTSPSGEWLK